MALSSLAQRVVTAVALVPLVLAALFLLGPGAFALAALAVVLVASSEWARIAGCGPAARVAFLGLLLVVASWLVWRYPPLAGSGWPAPVVPVACGIATLFWAFVAPAWLRGGWTTRAPATMSLVGLVALGGLFVALVELQARSPWLVLAAMAVVWIADTAAYFAGRAFGRRKLAPSVSPNKTWEGVYGGLAAVALYAVALAPAMETFGYRGARGALPLLLFVGLLAALAAVSVVGDLYESLMKRHAGVKDSGALLPGHGGLLDRIDALVAAMPPAALAATLWLQPVRAA